MRLFSKLKPPQASQEITTVLPENPPNVPDVTELFDSEHIQAAERALSILPLPNENARRYMAKHLSRLARTIALVPPPQQTGRVLELGCYMQITPFLERLCGYREVRGAYYGPEGKVDYKVVAFADRDFECYIDHFNAERDHYPYVDHHFDLVIAGEIIEHLVFAAP